MTGRDYDFREPTLRRKQTVGSEDLSGELQCKSEEPQPTEPKDDAEAHEDFCSIHSTLSAEVPKEKTCPTPLEYNDVTRSTRTNLDVMQGKRIDDYWNVDENKNLSDSWRSLTKLSLLKEKPPQGFVSFAGD